ncbi:MAG: hypothetical protein ACOZJZ_13040 [Pseudomonadota bacterium]
MANDHDTNDEIVELSSTDGVAFIEQASPLTRLHYFDGQYLRAAALTTEQAYHRHALQLANLAGGWGVVHGFGIALAGSELQVTAGLGITAAGHFVLANGDMHAKLADLLQVAAPPAPEGKAAFAECLEAKKPGVKATAGLQVYEITVGPIEGLCGNEPVYGKLCETACATDSRRPYWREGVVLRLRPVTLALPTSSSVKPANVHLRNRVASAYFDYEPWLTPSALSAAGLASGVWCQPAQLYGRNELVIGLLAREGGVVRVLDAWSGRRERMDTQARGYWQGRMAMRPWNVFVAQILQFQCQLSGLFDADHPVILPDDDCDQLRGLLAQARKEIETLLHRYGSSAKKILLRAEGRPTVKEYQSVATEVKASFADLDGLSLQLAKVDAGKGALPQQRMLLNAGFFELPPAGYLPVSLSSDVQEQTRRMFGEGVNLHFHAVRSDEIAHLVEEAQHMERISLTRGLDNPKEIEQVEIFVPDGKISDAQTPAAGTWWRVEMLTAATRALGIFLPSKGESKRVVPAPEAVAAAAPAAAKRRGNAKALTINTNLEALEKQRLSTLFNSTLDGLARTEGQREDGSYGFALVASSDVLQPGEPDRNGQDATGKTPWIDLKYKASAITAARGRLATYVAADVAGDPFTQAVGGRLAVSCEIASMFASEGKQLQFNGTLTVLAQRAQPSGEEERLVQLDLVLAESQPGEDTQTRASRVRLLLQRDGDGNTGFFIVDDEKQDPTSSPVIFEWDDAPRRAAMFIQATDATGGLIKRMAALRALSDTEMMEAAEPYAAFEETQALAAAQRRKLLAMSALPAMPEPASTVGTNAMNALVALADAADDAALLVRSRKRLFPSLDAPKTQQVHAKHDWLMFRRARTHLCGPACTTPPALVLEAFQVWHLKLENEKNLGQLAKALDGGDAAALAQFDFKRVGLLRYRDESAFSEESPARVLAMWEAAQPATRVALGRIWESAPEAGQGWQNHFRLRNMLEQIASLTKPPLRGDGALAAIAPPPGVLDDKALDGGMLVVTLPDLSSRNALLIYGRYDTPNHFLDPDFPQSPMQFDNNVPQGDALKNFIAGLTAEMPVRGVTLATTKAAPDADAKTRLDAVIAALKEAGKPDVPVGRQKVSTLNDHDQQECARLNIDPSAYDEIIFFELNAGG